ncbi:MAG: TolC family protein [Bacteroidales bacterium]|nr:TolC family protein [Bacteroidales bacterium]
MHRILFLIFILSGLTLIAHNQTRSLDFYLKEGLQNSPLLNDYRNQINSAIADSLLISAAKKPLVEAKSQLQYSPFYRNFGYDEVITDGGNYMAVMGVTQNVFNKRELNNKYKAVDLQKQLINNSSRISVTELNKIITDQYLTAFSGYGDFLFNKAFLELFKKENEIVKQFVKNGVYKQTDYLSLLVETQSQEILVNQLKSQYRKDVMLLNQLCGLNDSAWIELVEPQFGIKGTPDIAKSPSYIQYKIDSIRIENEKMAIDIRYKPKINWFADAGIMTSDPWNFYRHVGYSAGISLNIPVYDGKQRGIEKQKLEFNENSRKTYENNYRNQYFQHIQQLSNELKALNEMSAQLEKQLKTADQLVKALKEQLEAGIIQMTEYINAIKNFKTISRNFNLINIQKLQVINEMNFLLTQ